MNKHNGQIVEYVIRRNGHNLSALSKLLNVNRRSLYNWFADRNLRSEIIYRIGTAVDYDFSKEFPEMFTSDNFVKVINPSFMDNTEPGNEPDWQMKYITLLEQYNAVLMQKMSA
jgi:hypothetical protein